ncbi:MAG: mitochondrial fission ELM1 family protein [Hyphomicrobiaceae bacterium]
MSRDHSSANSPLAGRKAWLITDDKVGMQVQVKGVADALGLDWVAKQVAPSGLFKFTAPWGPPDRRDRFGAPGSQFEPPWPDLAIATGRLSIPYIRALRRHAGMATYTVVLQDPRTGPKTADLIWVPEHDKRRGANVMTTLTAAHSFTSARIAGLADTEPAWLAALPKPRIAIILGGNNAVYRYTNDDDARLGVALASMAGLGASFMVTPSRRTHPGLLAAVERATATAPRYIWNGEGQNPYPQFLAHADQFVATGDSVNMTGEPLVTGRPVWVFEPTGGSAKFARFHASLRRYGATRSLPNTVTSLEAWTYAPLDAAGAIAREIEVRWLRRQAMLGG